MSPHADGPSDLSARVARIDAWLETMRGSASKGCAAGYGGPVVHWWRQCLLYTGPGLDWRYEGIIAGYHGRGADELVHRGLKDFARDPASKDTIDKIIKEENRHIRLLTEELQQR